MTDPITLLTSDHRTVEDLFSRAERSAPDRSVINEIIRELSVHDAIEKEYLYPAVRNVGGGDAMADHSLEEHNEVANTLLALDRTEDGSTDQRETLATLTRLVRTHVEEEETQIFPSLRQNLSADDLAALGDKLAAAKASAPTRPHPHAPNEGLGTKIAGAVSAPLDKAKDAAQGRN